MRKVLYVSAGAERGGLEVVLLNTVKCLDRSRFVPLVLFLADGPFVNEVAKTGTAVHVIKAGHVRNVIRGIRVIAEVTRLIRAQGIDLVHSHNAKAHVYGGVAAAITSTPSLYHLHGVPKFTPNRNGLLSLLAALVPARRTIVCSNYVGDAIKRAWWSRRELVVIQNGVAIDPTDIAEGSPTVREELGILEHEPLITMACRLQRWKGVHVFLDAASRLLTDGASLRFLIVGGSLFGLEESYAEELRAQARGLGLAPAVLFTGYRPDVYRFMLAADLVVHSSIEPDPFPTVLLEAMALGKPVVASDLGGPREIVEDGVTGLLIPPARPDLLAHAIRDLLNDHERRTKMGEAAALRSRSFRAEAMVRRLEAVYEEVIRTAGHGATNPNPKITQAARR